MCLIIAAHEHRYLPVSNFEDSIYSAIIKNPDGIGLTFPKDGKTVITKQIKNYQPIIDQAIDLYLNSTVPFLLHLRYATVGKNTLSNTHPFAISNQIAMVHNSTLEIEPPHRSWSDSRTVAQLLKHLVKADRDFFNSPLFYSFIEHQAGHSNRFAFLDSEANEIVIINESLGVEVGGVWFSNYYAWDPSTVGVKKHKSYWLDSYATDSYGLDEKIDEWESLADCKDVELVC